MSAGVVVREATLDDVAAMARLRDASGWSGGASEVTMRRYFAGEHHPREALAPRVAFVAQSGDEVVGYVAGHLTERFGCAGELQWILVDPAHRGGDVAARLLGALAAWFVEHDARRICVNVEPDNDRARSFYRRLGAREHSPYWLEWPDIAAAIGVV